MNKEFKKGCKVKDDFIEACLNTIAKRHCKNEDYEELSALYTYIKKPSKDVLDASPSKAKREWVQVVVRFWLWQKGEWGIVKGSRVLVVSGTYEGKTATVYKANPKTCTLSVDGVSDPNPTGNIYYRQLEPSNTKAPKTVVKSAVSPIKSKPDTTTVRRRQVPTKKAQPANKDCSLPRSGFPVLYSALDEMTVKQLKGLANKEFSGGCSVKDDWIEACLLTIAKRHAGNTDYHELSALYTYVTSDAKAKLSGSRAKREWIEVVVRYSGEAPPKPKPKPTPAYVPPPVTRAKTSKPANWGLRLKIFGALVAVWFGYTYILPYLKEIAGGAAVCGAIYYYVKNKGKGTKTIPHHPAGATFHEGGQFVPGGGRAPKGGCYCLNGKQLTFYKGGQFVPGGGQAPAGGCWL